MISTIEEIRALVHASTATPDREMELLCIAMARSKLATLTVDVTELDRLVASREVEIGRRSRDIAQLCLKQIEGPR